MKDNLDGRSRNSNTLISEDILPITSKRRSLGGLGFANIWIGMAIVISVFSFGASGIEGMSIFGVASATLVANIIIAIVGSLTGDIGVEHGLSFATYLRAPFGIVGVHFPAVARGIVASCWFGINTYIGSTAINYFTIALFGIDNWFMWFLIFAAVQIVNTMLGIKAIDKFASFAAPCIILITCWMFYKVNNIAAINNISILGYVPSQPTANCWLITMCANTGMWAALAADIPNMTRSLKAPVNEKNWFKRNRNNWIPQFATLPIIETFIAVIGAISYLTTGNWNPVEVIQAQAKGVTLLVLLVMVILAQWSTNTAANLVPPAMCFTNAFAKWNLPYKIAVLIAGLIGVCVMPWKILDQLYTYLGYFGSFLSALAGIMICDYYIIRKRRLNVQDLYKRDGQYRYHGGFNVCGIVAWILGTVAANVGSDYGYLFGLPTGFVVYLVLMKTWYLKKFPQAEVESGYSDEYLGISVGNDWVIPGYESVAGVADETGSLVSDIDVSRYTGGKEYEAETGHKLIITFGRQYGSRGKELAGILAKKLDLPIYDEDMIKLASRELDMDEEDIKKMDEVPRNELVHALTAGGMYAAREYESATSDKMFAIQSQIILDLAKKSSCIIVGRCSNYVLDNAKIPTIDVFVVAELEDRIRHIAERDHVDYEKAKAYVFKTEKKRQAYFNYYTTYEWGNPQYYNLCVNTSGDMSMDELAEHIAAFIVNKPKTAAKQNIA
ncbi:cytosine permease [Butyricicoccus porcorum]|uniref:cytosine permease n=1 Tax=Butyricicoccus porcorum TaxID=1945634 RepID=UPI003F4A94D1